MRVEISKSLLGWVVRTETDWFVRPTFEEAQALARIERERIERESAQAEMEYQTKTTETT